MFLGAGGLLAAALIVSCGDKPPTGPSPSAGPSPPVLSVTAVTIVGPASVPPGGSAQYTAMVKLSDGTEKAATTARWFSSPVVLLSIDTNTGVATGVASLGLLGEATVSVEVSLAGTGLTGQTRASREILVMPDGTFRMVGSVTDADSSGLGIPNAIVEARLGENPSSRKMAETDTDGTGRYALYGVPADSYLHVRRVGYLTVIERIQIGNHTTRDFRLRSDSNVPSFEGTYTMTVDATTCTSNRPLDPQYRVRTYTATIRQSGARLTVRLSDTAFAQASDGFTGIATPTGADVLLRTFSASYYFPNSYPPLPDVAERLDDGTFLEIITTDRGTRLTGTPDRVSGIVYMLRKWAALNGSGYLSGCFQPRITLTRR